MNQYRCETCKFKDATNEELRVFHLRRCTKCNFIIEPISHDQMEIHGCASHSDFNPQAERDVKELFREEIAKWKDEDPLFMAYVYGHTAGRKDGREKVLKDVLKLSNEVSFKFTADRNVFNKGIEELREGKDGE